jgi:hypothetical protein
MRRCATRLYVIQRVGLSYISVHDNLPWEPSLSVAIPEIHFKAVSAEETIIHYYANAIDHWRQHE